MDIISHSVDLLTKHRLSAYEISFSIINGSSASVRLGKVESLQQQLEKNLSISVYNGQQVGHASGADTSEVGIKSLVNAAIDIAKYTEPDSFAGLAPKDRLAWQVPDLELYQAQMPDIGQMVDITKATEEVALAQTGIRNSEGAHYQASNIEAFYANSWGLNLASTYSKHGLACNVIASNKDKSEMQTGYDYHSAIGFSGLNSATNIGKNAAQNALEKLNSSCIKSQTLPVIFISKVASSLFRHLMSAISGANQYKKTSFLLNSIGKTIVPNWLSLVEKPLQKAVLGASAYDADGVLKQQQFFIKNGKVSNFIMGQYSANQLQLDTTACAGGTSNCYINSYKSKNLAQLIQKMHTGVIITDLMGQGVNLTTGNYSKGANGFFVANGQVKYPISGITIAGNLKNMLAQIIDIADDIDMRNKIKVGSTLIETMSIAGR